MSVTAAADEESRQFPYWRRNLRVLPVANLLCSLGFALSWPFLPLMVRGLGVHENLETWVGNMMLVFYLIGFAINPIWGDIADHYGRKIMVLRAMLGMGFVDDRWCRSRRRRCGSPPVHAGRLLQRLSCRRAWRCWSPTRRPRASAARCRSRRPADWWARPSAPPWARCWPR